MANYRLDLQDFQINAALNRAVAGGTIDNNIATVANDLASHASDTDIHVTPVEKASYAAKQDGITAVGILKGDGTDVDAAIEGTDYAPPYTYGTTDLTAGTSPLATGTLYFVYEV